MQFTDETPRKEPKGSGVRMKLSFAPPAADDGCGKKTKFADDVEEQPRKEPKKSSVRMKLSFASPEENEKNFSNNENDKTLEERKAEFMNDEELMREATKFVSEIVERARVEAARRAEQNAKTNGETNGKGNESIKNDNTIAGWNNRAKGFCNRVWNAVFPCFNNNGKS